MSLYAYVHAGQNRYRECFGLSFEDLHEGMRIRHRPGIDVSSRITAMMRSISSTTPNYTSTAIMLRRPSGRSRSV